MAVRDIWAPIVAYRPSSEIDRSRTSIVSLAHSHVEVGDTLLEVIVSFTVQDPLLVELHTTGGN